jgi:hypothetical protein
MVLIRGGLISKSLCGMSYKKFFKIPLRPLFVTFCMGDYKTLAAIAALPQWPVRPVLVRAASRCPSVETPFKKPNLN